MPIYEYACRACQSRFERLVRAFGEKVACPGCGAQDVERLLSTFAMASGGAGRSAPAGGGCCGGGCGCAH
jgi:putative FmdB family regulatory protein